jgi:hypothetical protein
MTRKVTATAVCIALVAFSFYFGFYIGELRQRCLNATYNVNQFLIRARFPTSPSPPQVQRLEDSILLSSISELQRMPRWVSHFVPPGEPDTEQRKAEKTRNVMSGVQRAGGSISEEELDRLIGDFIARHHTYSLPKRDLEAINQRMRSGQDSE